MTRPLLTILLFCALPPMANAQLPVVWFELTPDSSLHKTAGSRYNHLEFIDSRADTTVIGPIQTGIFNNQDANLVFKRPTRQQLEKLMAAAIDSAAGNGTLLLQLRDFNFVENYGSRYVFVRATMYKKEANGYRILSDLDEHTQIRNLDIQFLAVDFGHRVFNQFISRSLSLSAADSTLYSMTDIANIDSIEKSRLPLYTTDKYTDGIYLSYASFGKQIPDQPGSIRTKKDGTISSVRMVNDTGQTVRARPKGLYAVVCKGKPYVATAFGFYPLEKIRNNLFFTGDIRIAPVNKDVLQGFANFGLLGAVENAVGFRKTYDLIIDPANGKFIHLRQIPNTDTP